jgi:signal transduction histidine kinase/Tfp pilus assembly protein PilF
MKKYNYFLIPFLILSINLFSQINTDSLEKRLSQFIGTNKEKVDILNKLAERHYGTSPEKSIEYGQQALALSKQLNFHKGQAKSLENIGIGHSYLGNYNKALEYLIKSLTISEKTGYIKGVADTTKNIGINYRKLSNYDMSLKYYLKSLKIYEQIKDKNGVTDVLNNIGIVYGKLGNFDKALEYFLKSLKVYEEMGNKKGISFSSINIGNVYYFSKKYNQALEYFLKSLKILKELGNKFGIASSMSNIGEIYQKLGDYDKALEYYSKSLKIVKEIGDKNIIVINLIGIGNLYLEKKKYNKSLYYLEQGLELAKKIGAKDLIQEIYKVFSDLYSRKSNYKKAFQYYLLYSEVKDSIFTKESNKKIAEMQTKYETEKKEKEIEILRKDKKIQNFEIIRQKNVRNSFIAISGLILVLVLVIYSRYHTKKKANTILSKKNIQITEQKNQLSQTVGELRETQKILVDTAHRAGMAEIASGLLHNIGNVLNSVKVSSQLLKEKIEKSKVNELQKVLDLIKQHQTDLSDYITSDKKGKMLPAYLIKVGKILNDEQNSHLNELTILGNGIYHIEEIVTVQQNYAGVSGVVELITLSNIMDDVLKMYQDTFKTHMIEVVKHYKELPPILVEKGKLMQVFVNLLKNAQESLVSKGDKKKVITINISEDEEEKHQIVEIIDNGTGIKKDHVEQIFSYGFTTKKGSQGLGLHTSALTMAEMGGKIVAFSEGEGRGVAFTVILPENKQ